MRRKGLFIIEQTVNQMIYDDIMYPLHNGKLTGLTNTSQIFFEGKRYGGNTKFCELFASRLIKKNNSTVNCKLNEKTFTGADNIDWYLPVSFFQSGYESIKFDVNGDKEPNCEYNEITCPKPDTFTYYIVSNTGQIMSEEPDIPLDSITVNGKTFDLLYQPEKVKYDYCAANAEKYGYSPSNCCPDSSCNTGGTYWPSALEHCKGFENVPTFEDLMALARILYGDDCINNCTYRPSADDYWCQPCVFNSDIAEKMGLPNSNPGFQIMSNHFASMPGYSANIYSGHFESFRFVYGFNAGTGTTGKGDYYAMCLKK